MKKIILLLLTFTVNHINAVYVIDYNTGECVSVYPSQKYISRYLMPSSITDFQSLTTESMVTVSRDNTLMATIWGRGYEGFR